VESKIDAALIAAAQTLENSSDTARLDAELLMAHALHIGRGDMLLKRRDLAMPDGFHALIERRHKGEPVAYIIGVQEFWSLPLMVTPDTLIPRADSETLIEAAEAHCLSPPHTIFDLGTGSGALLLAALSLFPKAKGTAIDASAAALSVAQSNAQRLGFTDRASFHHLSWRDAGWDQGLGHYDLILCNPPYVEEDAALSPSVRNFEPGSALFAGADGLDDYKILIPHIPDLLNTNGVAIFEIGQGQEQDVSEIARKSGLSVQSRKDLQGISRALILR
jgi:release factor glutamine methyltransferase